MSKVCKVILPSFEKIYEEHYENVYGLALSIVRNIDDAQEVLNDTFERFWRKRHLFKGECKLSSWLYRITANLALMVLRKKKQKLGTVYIEDLKGGESKTMPWDIPMLDEKIPYDFIYTIYGIIDVRDNALVEMLAMEYSNAEMAAHLGVTIPAIKSRSYRIRERLKSKWATKLLRAA